MGLAQCPSAQPGTIAANPNRPTVSDPADITQYGVAEVEYGFIRTWDRGASHRSSVDGLFKFAALCDLELRWTLGSFASQSAPQQTAVHGMGDNWVGAQYRLRHQTGRVPTLAVRYEVKLPSARAKDGLGTGELDHAFTFLASKDIKSVHFDFNVAYLLSGRPDNTGNDQNNQLALAFSRTIHGHWAITGEVYGNTHQNTDTPEFITKLWGITYTVRPRLVLDAGIDTGLTYRAPQKSVFAGFTYSVGNFLPMKRSASHKFSQRTTTTASNQEPNEGVK
jgi:hypothetical protein